MTKRNAHARRTTKAAPTLDQWAAEPGKVTTRGEVLALLRVHEQALLARVAEMIAPPVSVGPSALDVAHDVWMSDGVVDDVIAQQADAPAA